MKNVVIAGSAKLQDAANKWVNYFTLKNCNVLDYPKSIDEEKFMELYPKVHTEFFENIKKADILFIMNEDKNGINGYIGYETYGELICGLML